MYKPAKMRLDANNMRQRLSSGRDCILPCDCRLGASPLFCRVTKCHNSKLRLKSAGVPTLQQSGCNSPAATQRPANPAIDPSTSFITGFAWHASNCSFHWQPDPCCKSWKRTPRPRRLPNSLADSADPPWPGQLGKSHRGEPQVTNH